MESFGVLQFMKDKTLLVTGATGFLAKVVIAVLVEKILRVQPNVKKLYLLIRAEDAKSAMQRMLNEVMEKDLFKVLRDARGDNLESFILENVTAVPGDVSSENLGIRDSNLQQEMWREIDFVVHSAATTNFDERYDVALETNTMGTLHVLNFAKNCVKTQMLLYVSTAYVCGEKSGLILESSFHIGETLVGSHQLKLDIAEEKKSVENKLNQLRATNADKATVTSIMKDFGIERARLHGWPNTYVFTKAMAEMLLGYYKDNMPIVIIRPTMITSTFKEPFPGWVEGLRTIDAPIVGYGKGKLKCLLANPHAIYDLIPADMVVNSMIMAMMANANNRSSQMIYHVGSSLRNPIKFLNIHTFSFLYFTKTPYINNEGKPVKVGKITILDSSAKFQRYMAFRYVLPLKGLKLLNSILCGHFGNVLNDSNRKIKFVIRLVELYKPYMFFKGIFDDTNTEKLRMTITDSGVKVEAFNFDPKSIDWEDYIMNTHIPGLMRYVVK